MSLKNQLEQPLVSVILPVYNGGPYLEQAIQSVLDQTFQDWELIVVNDGSTDCSESFLRTIVHPRVMVIHQPNMGVSAARNAGLALRKGKYLAFLDADDLLPPRSLESRVRFLEGNPGTSIVDGMVSIRDQDLVREIRTYEPHYTGPLLPRLLKLDDRTFFGPSYMFRSSTVGDARFVDAMTHAEDLLFAIRISADRAASYGVVTECVYIYRVTGASAMANLSGLQEGYIALVRNVSDMNNIGHWAVAGLRMRIAKILLLSWVAKGEWQKGCRAAIRILTS